MSEKNELNQFGTTDKPRIPKFYWDDVKLALRESAACGCVGAFSTAADVVSIATIWGYLLYSFASYERCTIDKDTAVDICKSALLGMGGYYAGCQVATKAFMFIPGAGIPLAMGCSSVTNILFTYRFALTLCSIFCRKGESGLNLEELVGNIKNMFTGNGIVDDVSQIVLILKEG